MLRLRIAAFVAICAICASALCAGALLAQPRARIATDSLVRGARSHADAGDTVSALELLEQATDQSPRDPDALYWRGLVLARTTALTLGDTPRRMLAWRLLNRAAGIDTKNPRYLLELGRIRLRTPLTRVEAERLFKRALAVAVASGDPAQVADVAPGAEKVSKDCPACAMTIPIKATRCPHCTSEIGAAGATMARA